MKSEATEAASPVVALSRHGLTDSAWPYQTAPSFEGGSIAEPPLKSSCIAIIGYAETSQPPEEVWADPRIEKWTLNHGHGLDPKGRWDRLFEFHSRECIDDETVRHHRGVDQWAVLQGERRRPIYMRDRHDDVPCSLRFPIEAFVQTFGARCDKLRRQPYVEMAAGYMLGYAVMKLSDWHEPHPTYNHTREDSALTPCPACAAYGRPEIRVYGFELFDGEEYAHQRACFEFYAGWAMGAGIRMTVPETSSIFSNRGLYEYDNGETSRLLNQADRYLGERFEEMKTKFAAANARNQAAVSEMQTISGIMQEVEQQRKVVRHLLHGGNFQG